MDNNKKLIIKLGAIIEHFENLEDSLKTVKDKISDSLKETKKTVEYLEGLKENIEYCSNQGFIIKGQLYRDTGTKINSLAASGAVANNYLGHVTELSTSLTGTTGYAEMQSLGSVISFEQDILKLRDNREVDDKFTNQLPSIQKGLVENNKTEKELSELLIKLNDDYYSRYNEAVKTLSLASSENLRQGLSSLRELFNNIIWKLAPKEKLKKQGYVSLEGKVTREARFKYIMVKGLNISSEDSVYKIFIETNYADFKREYATLFDLLSVAIHTDKIVDKQHAESIMRKFNFIVLGIVRIWSRNKSAFE